MGRAARRVRRSRSRLGKSGTDREAARDFRFAEHAWRCCDPNAIGDPKGRAGDPGRAHKLGLAAAEQVWPYAQTGQEKKVDAISGVYDINGGKCSLLGPGHGMRVRRIIGKRKTPISDTGWRSTHIQPRHAPFYVKTRPLARGYKWRSTKATDGTATYIMLAHCNPSRAKWQAVLAKELDDGFAVVARFEDHGSHQGVHVHTDCERSGGETGPNGLDNLARVPEAKSYHRRIQSWTDDGFWTAAKLFFRIDERSKSEDDDKQTSLDL